MARRYSLTRAPHPHISHARPSRSRYTPKPEFPGPFTVFNEKSELDLLKKWCAHLRELQPQVVVTYNGDNFDFPYIHKRCEVLGLDLKKETG